MEEKDLPILNSFYRYLKTERQRTEKTINSYRFILNHFCSFLSLNENELIHITAEKIGAWLEELDNEKYSVNSKNQKVACLKSFYHFLLDYDYIDKSPMRRIKLFKQKDLHEIDYLEEDEVLKFLSACKNMRDKVIFTTFFTMGLRLSEVIGIKVQNTFLDSEIPYLIVKCKGDKVVKKIIPNILVGMMKEYINKVRPSLNKNKIDFLFISNQGTPMNAKALNYTCKCIAKRANINKNIHPHCCRHSFATNQLKKGANIKQVQELLGHASANTTANIYMHISNEDKALAINNYNFNIKE